MKIIYETGHESKSSFQPDLNGAWTGNILLALGFCVRETASPE